MTLQVLIEGKSLILHPNPIRDYFSFLWSPNDVLNNIFSGFHLSCGSQAKKQKMCKPYYVSHEDSEEMS